ncbi:uncharacterized protein TNCV_2699311 [Trichonephila clavipes]|nr:uncharacterized protein TNCV_2699311 [Trichonephila clavipes]
MSEDLSKFKKKRTAVRSSLTKLINKIEGKINNENEPVDQFEAFIEQLNDKESNLSLLNTLIEDRLSVDTITEDMEASEEIKEKIIFWKTKLSSKIRRINSDSMAFLTLAFLMIEIDESERDFTRFFWDENPGIDLENKRLDIFRMTRVLFGVKSSPFLLAATIKHHLKKYVDIFPDTFNHLNQSLYVDDFLCGNVSVQAALTTCIESKQILEDASMDLRKWRTNSSELNQRLKNLNFEVDEHKESLNTLIASKVLGVGWNEKSDTFYFDSSDLGTFLSKRINTKKIFVTSRRSII